MPRFLRIIIFLVLVFFTYEGVRVFRESNSPVLASDEPENIKQEEEKVVVHEKRKTPKLTIVFVADAFGKGLIDKVSPFLDGGIHYLQTKGTNYLNVFHPHGSCCTAQGHASMTTGTFPSYHGMVNNQWLDGASRLFSCVQDDDLSLSGVFNPENGHIYNVDDSSETISYYYRAGVSPRNYKVDNLSDQLMLFSTPKQTSKVFSISSHQEPAVLMAGRLGKALWLDGPSGLFTTSKYYYPQGAPSWVKTFNEAHKPPKDFVWEPAHPLKSGAYDFSGAKNYSYSDAFRGVLPERQTLFGQSIRSDAPVLGFQPYISSPLGIHTLYDFANKIIDTELSNNPNERLVLWVNHVAFDTFAGLIGPQTQDAIDIGYHLDKGIQTVISHAYKKVDPADCLFVFCSDEAYYPSIPEVLESEGFDLAKRTVSDKGPVTNLVEEFNKELGCQYIQTMIPPFVYMNRERFDPLSPTEKDILLEKVKVQFRSTPGIKDAWGFDEIVSWPFEREDQGRFFKLHAFRNNPKKNPPQERRSGEVIFQSLPFNYVTSNLSNDSEPMFGVDHTSCYDYDSHTALYVYQKGRFQAKEVQDPVMIQQVAISLAEILQVPRPSAASVDVGPLPKLEIAP